MFLVTGRNPGHHVPAQARLARAVVKAASPAERGRSEAKSLDDREASPRLGRVMPGQARARLPLAQWDEQTWVSPSVFVG